MLLKEYRICMPLTVDEYRIGQLYMISKHSCEQSDGGAGVEVVQNEHKVHAEHGPGQQTAILGKIICPEILLCDRKGLEFLPTHNHRLVSFLPRFSIRIDTKFENNNGENNNVFGDQPTPKESVSFLDILSDPIPEKHYKESEDLSLWYSNKTDRGPLQEGWRSQAKPIMCSYKRVSCSFEVYGLQGRTEEFIHKTIQDILLVGHRQAVAWIDEWHGMSLDQVRDYERELQEKTNSKVKSSQCSTGQPVASRPTYSRSISVTDERSLKKMGVTNAALVDSNSSSQPSTPMRLHSTTE
ncbi:Cytoplasmic phosphatidylinositol transfer protein 1 [Merluccius polli]|uniref:Cytoplasmic phosphatidylinositol transfer protein 1 n=1 Tax=Merluccius polli TaxID=89951 RepID=A0AA47P6E0_MERPO|nr:Cytoplasmic phosphatidylinositol transfer protein 1 [Merluccius polli]